MTSAARIYTIVSPTWMIAEKKDWRQEVLISTFARVGGLLVEKVEEVRAAPRALTDEEQEVLITAFKNFLEIHTLLHTKKEEEE